MSGSGAGAASDPVEFYARFVTASRNFIAAPSTHALRDLLASYSLWHVASRGSEEGLDGELIKIEANARNIMAGRP